MTPDEWLAQGRKDHDTGVPRVAAPSAEGTEAGDHWRAGWDAAAIEDEQAEPEAMEILPVRLELRDGRLLLTDARGRAIGSQVGLVVEQGEELTASVTFAGLIIAT